MSKYTDARYPEKVNDVIDNDGLVKTEALPPISGGTQLYKHALGVETNGEEIVCYVISASKESLAGKRTYYVYERDRKYISGVIDTYGNGEVFYPIILFTYESEPRIIYYSNMGVEEAILDSAFFLYDTVTEL